MGARRAQDGPRDGSKSKRKRGRVVQNRVSTFLNRSGKLLDAIFSHLQRSDADLTPHVRSVLALLHPNEPRKALSGPSWGRLGAQDARKMGPRWPKRRLQKRAKTWEGCPKIRLDALEPILNRSGKLLDAI